MPFCSIVKTSENKLILLMTQAKRGEGPWNIWGWRTREEALNYYEGGYNECHNRDYSWSMSATLNWLYFQPSIVEMDDPEMFRPYLADYRIVSVRNVSGGVTGITLKEEAMALWEAGTKPALIKR